MAARTTRLAGIGVFRDLPPDVCRDIEDHLQPVTVPRGRMLVRQGEEADALYVVVTGRFEVLRAGRAEPVAEIGPGSPIGEIAFFAGGQRTASVRAERDGVVLKLTRDQFDALARRSPGLWSAITATLAQRLAATTAVVEDRTSSRTIAVAHTVCLVPAGAQPLDRGFVHELRRQLGSRRVLFLASADAPADIDGGIADDSASGDAQWYNDLESRYDLVVYVADDGATAWSRKCIRQADLVLAVGQACQGESARQPNALEQLAAELLKPRNLRLVLLQRGEAPFSGTRGWLAPRPWLHAHHHVRAGCGDDHARLVRFMTGRAQGLVACGGGAFSSAHIGVYQALSEGGFAFDIMGGTSGGAAMTAAFVRGVSPDEVERGVHEIFVTRRAMRRWTWPRYSLLDPSVLDDCLEQHYGTIDIEDLALPWFGVATNLSRNAPETIRSGPLWQAVRASSAIPALLPPVIDRHGDMLVDGCLLANVPVETMHTLKTGPNVVVDFKAAAPDPCQQSVPALSRLEIVRRSLGVGSGRQLPPGPSPQAVLMRALMMHNQGLHKRLRTQDLLLEPPMPDGVSHLDWHRHGELRSHAYHFARQALAERGSTA